MSTLRIAWRNLRRNRRRTAITVAAVAANTAILIASLALTEGMLAQLERNVTRVQVGDAQVHAVGYRKERSMYLNLSAPDEAVAAVERTGARVAPRSFGFGLVSHGTKSSGVVYTGVDPQREARAFDLAQKLAKGTWLNSTPSRDPQAPATAEPAPLQVVIGSRLARSLHAEAGTELVALVQAADGSTGAELLQVRGILRAVGEEIDRGGVFMHRSDFDGLFAADGRVHELAIALGEVPMQTVRAALAPHLQGAELMTWRELMPPMAEMLQMVDVSIALFALVFFLGAGLGVLNTMLMATHDRVREFGVIKALGGTSGRIVRDVAAEGLMLGLVSTGIGVALGVALGLYLQFTGIDLSGLGQESVAIGGMAWEAMMYGEMTVQHVVLSVLVMVAACVLASLYPAVKAARLSAAQAMSHR